MEKFCWTELCVNSICHRDYSILGTDIQVKIFDDHITVESPGIFPGLVKPDNIRHTHFSRNPKVAAYMHEYKLVKVYGYIKANPGVQAKLIIADLKIQRDTLNTTPLPSTPQAATTTPRTLS